MNTLHVEFDVPASVAREADLHIGAPGDNIKLITAMFLYEHGKLSLGKACELGGISQWEFLEMNKKFGISLNYSEADLQSDLELLKNV